MQIERRIRPSSNVGTGTSFQGKWVKSHLCLRSSERLVGGPGETRQGPTFLDVPEDPPCNTSFEPVTKVPHGL